MIDFSKYKNNKVQTAPSAPPEPGIRDLNGYKPFERGNYHRRGEYIEKVARCLTKMKQDTGEPLYIVELEIVKLLKADEEPHSEGELVSYIQKLSNPRIAGPALAGFVCAALGAKTKDAVEVVSSNLNTILSAADQSNASYKKEDDDLVGKVVRVKCFPHITRDKKEINLLQFFALNDEKNSGD
jgi:hypothetical protein